MNQINASRRAPNQPLSSASPVELLGPGLKALSDALVERPSATARSPQAAPVPAGGNVAQKKTEPLLSKSNLKTLAASTPKEGKAAALERQVPAQTEKVDTDALQDIFQCSGVDLKEEAENILKEQEYLLSSVVMSAGEDPHARLDTLFNADKLKKLVDLVVFDKYFLTNDKKTGGLADIYEALLIGVQFKFCHMIDELVMLSRHRADLLKSHFKVKMDNDPKRQLFALEKVLSNINRNIMGRYEVKDEEQGGSKLLVAATHAEEEQPSLKKAKAEPVDVLSPVNIPASIASSLTKDTAKIKTRLSNVTAMNQLGLPVKSWMTGAPSSGGSSSSTMMMAKKAADYIATETPRVGPSKTNVEPVSKNAAHATAPKSFTPTALGRLSSSSSSMTLPATTLPSRLVSQGLGLLSKEGRIASLESARTISIKDLIVAMEMDPDLSRSPLLTRAYFELK